MKKELLALPIAAAFIYTALPASAEVVYYTTSSPAVIPTSTYYSAEPVTYIDSSGAYILPSSSVQTRVLTQSAVMPTTSMYVTPTTTVDTGGSALGRVFTGAAVGAGLGAVGGVIGGALSRGHNVGRGALIGTGVGAAVGGGLGLLNGLFNRNTQPVRQVASPGYYWY